jgi:hypothetical protein
MNSSIVAPIHCHRLILVEEGKTSTQGSTNAKASMERISTRIVGLAEILMSCSAIEGTKILIRDVQAAADPITMQRAADLG